MPTPRAKPYSLYAVSVHESRAEAAQPTPSKRARSKSRRKRGKARETSNSLSLSTMTQTSVEDCRYINSPWRTLQPERKGEVKPEDRDHASKATNRLEARSWRQFSALRAIKSARRRPRGRPVRL